MTPSLSKFRALRRLGVANRGEPAMRCIRAVKALRAQEGSELRVVTFYTDADRDAPFVRHADASHPLPAAASPVAAYLDRDGMLGALRRAGCDAVWPGWGFLAEDPEFADRIERAGLVFLGPRGDAMRRLGDKIAAKQLAERAGVPVTPWSGGPLADAEAAARCAAEIGFPAVLKAAAGGGGRGIRMVAAPEALEPAFRSAAAEAASAFGDSRLFLERRVSGGRHVEVQIAADASGEVIALGCRDCSVQRRHQKLIEEAPPPGLPRELLSALEAAAVRLAREVGYRGLGTVEFLVCAPDFYFLEMNPRLQVEHGVTEEVAGVDLVQLQVRIARGERVAPPPEGPQRAAIEARVCAEDPDEDFLPAPGRIVRFDPALGPHVRIDAGVAAGSFVPAEFDSLLAKVIATGRTREEARGRLACALQDFDLVVERGATNRGFLLELLDSAEYRDGKIDTDWVDRFCRVRPGRDARAPAALVAASVLAYQHKRGRARAAFYADVAGASLARIPPSTGQEIELVHRGVTYQPVVYAVGSWRYRVHLEGAVAQARLREAQPGAAVLELEGRSLPVLYDLSPSHLRVEVEGQPYRFGWESAGHVRAASPSLVIAIHVASGEGVEAGQPLGLLEAMKSEIAFRAPVSGTVTEICVRRGQQVAAGEILLKIDPATEARGDTDGGARIALPREPDPLDLFFAEGAAEADGRDGPPPADLARAGAAPAEERRRAVEAARDEVLRVLLGYDANPARVEKLAAFLEAPLAEGLPGRFRRELAEVCAALPCFPDVEQLFTRAPPPSVSGAPGPSNSARMRMYLRRIRAGGADIDEEFLDRLRAALRHYGVSDLGYSDALERAVLRLLATQGALESRRRLAMALVRRIVELDRTGLRLRDDTVLEGSLARIAGMRGQVPNALADAAVEARYTIFEAPEIERRAGEGAAGIATDAAAVEMPSGSRLPPALLQLADAPLRVFDRVGHWIASADPRRRRLAMAAHLARIYVPGVPAADAPRIHGSDEVARLELPDERVLLGGVPAPGRMLDTLRRLCDEARVLQRGPAEPGVDAIELLVPCANEEDVAPVRAALEGVLAGGFAARRATLSFLPPNGKNRHESFVPGDDGVSGPLPLHGVHPETAERVGLHRYEAFDLERLPCADGILCFHGRSREVPDDERVFVLGEVRSRDPGDDPDARLHLPAFEHTFHEATRALRTLLGVRDPRRRLHWNRVALFVTPPIRLDPSLAEDLARRLHAATRHLGLEKVLVRVNQVTGTGSSQRAAGAEDEAGATERRADGGRRAEPGPQTRPAEIVIADPSGTGMEIAWRDPHTEPLAPAGVYERKVVRARRANLVYPYEIVRMLCGAAAPRAGGSVAPLPRGEFEEHDLEPGGRTAVSVAGRPYGQSTTGVVFGVLSTPTPKVPEGVRRVLILSDPTHEMGALGPPECDRIEAAIDLAERLSLPVEWVPVSAGARIAMDSGTENLDATARVARRIVTFTQAGGVIHILVNGVNVGAQSYWNALATMLMHTRGALIMTPRASMVLTGRAALEASGGVAAEDEVAIGGFERVMGPNGEAQYYARDFADAYRVLYEHYDYTYVVPGEAGPRRSRTQDPAERAVTDAPYAAENGEGFGRVGEIFEGDTNAERKRPFAMRPVMSALVDRDGGHLERWGSLVGGETAIVWDAHLGGHPVCLIGIESRTVLREGYRPNDGPEAWTGGTLFPQSSKKVARALNAASGNRPVVILANLSGFDGSPESMRRLQLEYGAEIARAVVNFRGPLFFLVVSRYHGGAYVVFSRALNPELRAAALKGSYASVIGGAPAAKVVFAREVRARAFRDARVQELRETLRRTPSAETRDAYERTLSDVILEKQSELATEFDRIHSVERARDVGSLEHLLSPRDMRPYLIHSLDSRGRETGARNGRNGGRNGGRW